MSDSIDPNTIPREAFDWYDAYAHGAMDRRTFLARLASIAGSAAALTALTAAFLPDYAEAAKVNFNDPAIRPSYITFPSPDGHGEGRAYLVEPSETAVPPPVVLVVHENRGLNPYIEDVARRLGMAGFIALAPDVLYTVGGYPGNDDDGRALQREMQPAKMEADFIAAARFGKGLPQGSGKLGAVGFCYGGYIVNMLAARIPDVLDAGVAFYGTPALESLWSQVRGPLLIHYAEEDERVNAAWPGYEAALKQSGARYQAHHYPGTYHGFHNDSTVRYDEKAAELAWQRTVVFFRAELG